MKVVKGMVVSDVSPSEDGSFWVDVGKGEATRVAYTSPSYNVNNGGIFAPPVVDAYVLLFENEDPQDNEPTHYYMATIVDDPPLDKDKRIPEFKAVRATGPDDLYGRDKRPKASSLTNGDGQGIVTLTDVTKYGRKNYVALESEVGASVSVGEKGCQIVNEHKDGIVVQGEDNGLSPSRSISMTTEGAIFQQAGSTMGFLVGKGGADISIANLADTVNFGGCGISAGNIRIFSENKDITIKTGSPGLIPNPAATRNVNIIVPGAEIQVNGTTGGITIRSIGLGGLNLESATAINLNSPAVNVNGVLTMAGAGMSISPDTFTVDMKYVNIKGQLQANFQSDLATNVGGLKTTVQGESVRVHSKTPTPPAFTYRGTGPVDPKVIPGPDVLIPPASLAPLPSLSTSPATLGIPGFPSVVVPNTYGDSPVI